jgi:hypothetical protein
MEEDITGIEGVIMRVLMMDRIYKITKIKWTYIIL